MHYQNPLYHQVTKRKAKKDLDFLLNQLKHQKKEAVRTNNAHLLSRVARGDFRELVDRDGGRRDVRFQLDRFPFTCPGLVYNSAVYPLVQKLVNGGDVNLLYAGIMWAMPLNKKQDDNHHDNDKSPNRMNSEEGNIDFDKASQKYHGDGGHLFDHVHLPPHCINVFYPLVDLNKFNGPTDVTRNSSTE